MSAPAWLAALSRAEAFAGAPATADVIPIETHISWVFLVGDDAWKLKKPVDFGFLDFTTPERRRAACEAEIALNQRLAPDVYLGVAALCRRPDGSWHVGEAGPGDVVVEPVVHMRRLPDAWRASDVAAAGRLDHDAVERIAERLVRFHDACRQDVATDAFGTPEAIAVNVEENVAQAAVALAAVLGADEAAEITARQRRFLSAHADRLRARIEAGRVRDGHGDLRLEHVYLPPSAPVLALDCIEFNDRFRYADVASDLAFLAMDLTTHGRPDLAEHLLAIYARAANDYELYGVVDFYEAYRAWVRGKIAGFTGVDPHQPAAVRHRALADARRLFLVALGVGRPRVLPPVVVAVGGPVAAGKSTLANQLSRWLGAPVVEADRTRKHMLGVSATTRMGTGNWSGAYDPRFTEEVYGELNRRAGVVLASGRPVVIDASFRSASFRLGAKALADAHGVPFRFVECTAPRDVLAARLRRRAADPNRVSDADVSILDSFLAKWEPVVELAPGEHVPAPTDRPRTDTLATVHATLPSWPEPDPVRDPTQGAGE